MAKIEWYNSAQEIINNDLDKFYNEFYGVTLTSIGGDYRINPCPKCGHKNCCTISGNAVHCFSGSCGWKGTHINAWISYAQDNLNMSSSQAFEKLEEYIGIPFPKGSEKDMQAYKEHQVTQKILRYAENFYHNNLIDSKEKFEFNGKFFTALEYLIDVRCRKIDTVKKFSIGFSADTYIDLFNNLISEGFSKDEIKKAKVWAPKNVIIYFYKHPITNDIVRMNVKNPFKTKAVSKDAFGKYVESDEVLQGYSTFSKALYFSPDFKFDKDFVIVEGENDLHAVYEQGMKNVVAIGGQIRKSESFQLAILNKCSKNTGIYVMCDNDAAGDSYIETIDDYFADRKVFVIKYNNSYNDPDEYYTSAQNPKSINELIIDAEPLPVNGFKIYKDSSIWTIANRTFKLEFHLKSMSDKNTFKGTAIYYRDNELIDRDDEISLTKCKKIIKPLNIYLYNYIEEYFNSNLEVKTKAELVYIYPYSQKKEDIIRKIAEQLNAAEDFESDIDELKLAAKKTMPNWSDFIDSILKEKNDLLQKTYINSIENIPKMRLGQYYNVRNGDAYMYFTYVKIDGDVKRKLPFLLRNDGTLIRLDLLKRKDSQCLLLVDNKYELPYEINEAVLELNECCLTQYWVEKFKNNEIDDDELDPGKLVREIERYLKKFYYTTDNNVYRIVALYIYSTYYYELFAQIPYLFLNGSKGSGKSILDECIKLFSFNCKMAVDITEAALFRILSTEGGVLILDEMENLNSKNRTMDTGMASILKGGYARSGGVYRVNGEKGSVDKFNVYGPKVISNIMGMDDVIEDRCIVINTYPFKLTKETKMEDPKYYAEERLDEIRALTSKCALSALKNFKKLHNIYNNSLFETNNARLSQILTPVQAIATLVDLREIENAKANDVDAFVGEFQKSLSSYWESTLKFIKENIESDTPEGIIRKSVSVIARELWGLVPANEIELSNAQNHKYNEQILFNKEEGWFKINALHFKCFIEEFKPGESVYNKLVSRWVKTVFNIKPENISRRNVKIENEELAKEFKGNTRPKVYFYTFYFKDFIDISEDFLEKKADIKSKEIPLF